MKLHSDRWNIRKPLYESVLSKQKCIIDSGAPQRDCLFLCLFAKGIQDDDETMQRSRIVADGKRADSRQDHHTVILDSQPAEGRQITYVYWLSISLESECVTPGL